MTRNNIHSITEAFEAAGITFLSAAENDEFGVGVRFRKVEIEFDKDVRYSGGNLELNIRYKGEPYTVFLSEELIDDLGETECNSINQQTIIVSEHLPKILNAAERKLKTQFYERRSLIRILHSDVKR